MTAVPGPAALAASVLSLRMRGFADDPARQAGARETLLAAARKALAGWDPAHRVVLEAPDGLAFVGLVPPSVALRAAGIVSREATGASLGIGLHHGVVEVVEEGGQARVSGEGVETAAALAGFTTTDAVVASQAFREALAARSRRDADDLRPAGDMVDEQLRKHPVFVFDAAAARDRTLRRRLLAGGGLVLLLGAGAAARIARERYEAARRPAVIHFDVQPSGEVFIDGRREGATPPMLELKVPPGPHSIEVRSGRFPPLRLEVQLQPGEQLQLRHVFAAPPPPRRPRVREQERPSVIEQLKDRWRKLW
jgi:hypothetical protein